MNNRLICVHFRVHRKSGGSDGSKDLQNRADPPIIAGQG